MAPAAANLARSLHERVFMKSPLRRIRNAPFFPFVPFVPLLLASGLIALEALTLARVRRLGRTLEALVESQEPQAA
jgi:hypothetical protein